MQVRFGYYLDKRYSAAVIIDKGVSSKIIVYQFSGILLDVDAGDTDFFRTVFRGYFQISVLADRLIEL